MILEMLDPTIDGTLKILSPSGELCGILNFSMEVQHNLHNLPTIDFRFTTYKNVLGEEIN